MQVIDRALGERQSERKQLHAGSVVVAAPRPQPRAREAPLRHGPQGPSPSCRYITRGRQEGDRRHGQDAGGTAVVMSPLFSLFLTLWSLAGTNMVIHEVDGPVRFTDLYGSAREAAGAVGCPGDGKAHLWISRDVDMDTLVHEMAHVWDCIDDGQMNASPIGGARPAQRPAWAGRYCWDTDAEWYACWATRSLSVDASPLDPPRQDRAELIRRGNR